MAQPRNIPNNSQPEGENPGFEAAFTELTTIIDQLESGELTLEASMALFERGKRLLTLCEGMLDAADLRVQQLSGDSAQNFKVEPLN
jgi:exodeoxyribonuclease VII small subunit